MHKVERAIIMAAGVGKRMYPLTSAIPKPMIKVNGVRMIDTVIRSLHKNGIHEIIIVVGHLKEKFKVLEEEYNGVTLIDNPYFNTCNNISSLYVARSYLKNVIILDGDQIVYNDNILTSEFERSGYNCIWTDGETKEWLLTVKNDVVQHCSRTGGKKGWQLFSISRWSPEDGAKLRQCLEMEFQEKMNREIYWDDVALFCYLDSFQLGIKKMECGDIIEVDSLSELIAIDDTYRIYIDGGKQNGE